MTYCNTEVTYEHCEDCITIEEETLSRLDRLVSSKVFPNRSRAIQEAIQEKLSRSTRAVWQESVQARSGRRKGDLPKRGFPRTWIMARILRGEVYWATLIRRRVTNNPANGQC